jgi:L-ribulokinase
MSIIVAGVDFGTLNVRVSLFDSESGRLGSATADYALHRKREDPNFATQSHADHMSALASAMHAAIASSEIRGELVSAIALDTTGSSVIPVGKDLIPLDDYYLWCDHRARKEAAEITAVAREMNVAAIDWCGGVYSSEWGFAKLLHWLRHNPEKRARFVTAFEHCDMVAAVLCGVTDPARAPRSICAAGHKWLWNRSLGGSHQTISFAPSIHCSPVSRKNWPAASVRPTNSPASFARTGPKSWACAPESRFPWARLTRTGTPSAQARICMTSST